MVAMAERTGANAPVPLVAMPTILHGWAVSGCLVEGADGERKRNRASAWLCGGETDAFRRKLLRGAEGFVVSCVEGRLLISSKVFTMEGREGCGPDALTLLREDDREDCT